jgi:hypothetical protein
MYNGVGIYVLNIIKPSFIPLEISDSMGTAWK